MKKSKNKCKTKYCRGFRGGRSLYCNSCRHDRERNADPVKYCYDQLKRNARRRGKIFTITLEYWRQFCYRSDYIQNKGKMRESYTVDCFDPGLGYIEGNIRALPNHQNAAKGNRKLMYDYMSGEATVIKLNYDTPQGPF